MQLNITARHMNLTDGLRDHIEKELKKLQRRFHKESDIEVRLHVEKYRHLAEVTCHVGGSVFQASEETKDMYQSVDRAIESIGQRYKKFTTKNWSGKGKTRLNEEAAKPAAPKPAEQKKTGRAKAKPRIIRSRKYAPKPMSTDEAAMQLDLLENDFIVYTDSKTDQVHVLYRRKDGNLGLIVPVYE